MSIEQYLKKIFNEQDIFDDNQDNINDDYFAVIEIYANDDESDEDEWDDEIHTQMEAVKKVKVVRNGRPTFIARSTRPGYKIAHGREHKMNVFEKRAREKAAERTFVRKKRHINELLQSARKESISKREQYGIDKKLNKS